MVDGTIVDFILSRSLIVLIVKMQLIIGNDPYLSQQKPAAILSNTVNISLQENNGQTDRM